MNSAAKAARPARSKTYSWHSPEMESEAAKLYWEGQHATVPNFLR